MCNRTCLGRLALALTFVAGLPLCGKAAAREHYLPEDSEIVVNINVKQMLAAPFVKDNNFVDEAREALKHGPAASILKDIDFDPLKDLDRIVIAAPAAAKEADRGLAILHGHFNTTKLRAKAEELSKSEHVRLKIVKVPDGKGGDAVIYQFTLPDNSTSLFATIIDEKTILASPGKDYIVDAIRTTGGKPAPLKSKGLEALLDKMEERQSISVAAVSEAVKSLIGNDVSGLENLTALSGGLTLSELVKVEIGISTKEADEAKEIHNSLSNQLKLGVVALAGLTAADNTNPGFAVLYEVVKSIDISVKEKTVLIEGKIDPEKIQKILKQDK
jgi:hypothetical protein